MQLRQEGEGIYSGVSAVDGEHTPVSEGIPVAGWTGNPVWSPDEGHRSRNRCPGLSVWADWRWRLDWPNQRAATLRGY